VTAAGAAEGWRFRRPTDCVADVAAAFVAESCGMTPARPVRQLSAAGDVAAAVERLAGEMAEALTGAGPFFLAGIPTRGVALAERLAGALAARGVDCGCGSVDISMYRDDLGLRAGVTPLQATDLPVDIDKFNIVLVDDVQHTGRTARAAIEAVLAFGRPRRILYAVLVDRGGRELPVRPDFTGLRIGVPPEDRVQVRLTGIDAGEEGVFAS
jgi:pyrimidine operon attenuation protein/uracil phosphoribosyltransferase